MKLPTLLSFSSWVLYAACSTTLAVSQGSINTVREIAIESAQVDQLGNLYLANVVNEVHKYDPDGKQIGYYSNNSLGNIGRIDATSPLKILVFYPAFNTGVILDRRLLETGRFNLIEMGFGEINLISFSRDGTLWIYDDHAQRLYKVSQIGKTLQTSEDLRLVFDEHISPTEMRESGGRLYLSVPGRGILLFDLFGQFLTQISEPGIQDFQVRDDHTLIYILDNMLVAHDVVSLEKKTFPILDDLTNTKVLVTDQQMILISKEGVIRRQFSEFLGKN